LRLRGQSITASVIVVRAVAVAVADSTTRFQHRGTTMGLILLIVIILLLVGGLPTWRHSRNWGYGPSGALGLILIILLILVVLGQIPRGF
jgi:hypothetical protein